MASNTGLKASSRRHTRDSEGTQYEETTEMSSARKATDRVSCYCLYVPPRLALSELRDYW